MALDPLATAADLAAQGITLDPSETGAVEVFIAAASAAIRDAAGCPISQVTSTVTLDGTHTNRFPLPGGPVTAVAAVVLDGVTITDWKLEASGVLWRRLGWRRHGCEPSSVTVTYTHGLPEVPADIVALMCGLVAAALTAKRATQDGTGLAAGPRVAQERIGDYSVTYSSDTRMTVMDLSEDLRRRLAARFGNSVGGVVLARLR